MKGSSPPARKLLVVHRSRTTSLVVLAAVLALVVAPCGPRRPPSDFLPAVRGARPVRGGGALGPNVVSPSYYGASAFFQDLNAKGGINGRKIKFVTCDDKEDPNLNLQCAQSLTESQKIFAFATNDTRVGNGSASYISSKSV